MLTAAFATDHILTPCRQASRVGTKMLSMTVQVDKLLINTQDAEASDGEAARDSQVTCLIIEFCKLHNMQEGLFSM